MKETNCNCNPQIFRKTLDCEKTKITDNARMVKNFLVKSSMIRNNMVQHNTMCYDMIQYKTRWGCKNQW